MPPPTPAPVAAQIAFGEEDCDCPETGAVSVSRAQASTGRNTASLACRYEYADSDSFVKLDPYKGRDVERTYLNPSRAIMKGVLGASLDTVMQKMSSDAGFIQVLKKN